MARAVKLFDRGFMPVLVGMALAFTVVASLAAVGGWAIELDHHGRTLVLMLIVLLSLALLFHVVMPSPEVPLATLGDGPRAPLAAPDGR